MSHFVREMPWVQANLLVCRSSSPATSGAPKTIPNRQGTNSARTLSAVAWLEIDQVPELIGQRKVLGSQVGLVKADSYARPRRYIHRPSPTTTRATTPIRTR